MAANFIIVLFMILVPAAVLAHQAPNAPCNASSATCKTPEQSTAGANFIQIQKDSLKSKVDPSDERLVNFLDKINASTDVFSCTQGWTTHSLRVYVDTCTGSSNAAHNCDVNGGTADRITAKLHATAYRIGPERGVDYTWPSVHYAGVTKEDGIGVVAFDSFLFNVYCQNIIDLMSIELSTSGGDAMLVDRVHLVADGTKYVAGFSFGSSNSKAWCLSTQSGDYSGSDVLVGSCTNRLCFNKNFASPDYGGCSLISRRRSTGNPRRRISYE